MKQTSCHIKEHTLWLQYADWCGGNKDSFFTDSHCHQLYMNHIKTFVNRC